MKRQRFLAVLLSAVIAFAPAVQVMAEKNAAQEQAVESDDARDTNNVENTGKIPNNITEEKKQEDVQNDNNDEIQNGIVGGYIPSKLDNRCYSVPGTVNGYLVTDVTKLDLENIPNNGYSGLELEENDNSKDIQQNVKGENNIENKLDVVSEDGYSDSAASGNVTLKVEWSKPVLGQSTTFHVSATGGSGAYKFRMDAPSYSNPNEWSFESVADPSRGEWMNYTNECSSTDFSFTMTASGTYNFRFYLMDKTAGIYYLRVSTNIQVVDSKYPSVSSIVKSAVKQCNTETDESDYQKALWLHDWLLNQLEYDSSLKWSSAESALTRSLGTCQAYESAYALLLTAAGIPNVETRDTYDGHTWNAVKLNGEWYQVDCTWDDSNENWYNFDQRHLYFGLTDELMAIAHPGHSNIYIADGYDTRSTALADNYFVKNGDAAKWVESYRDKIQENLSAGKTEFTITADNVSYPPSIAGIQNGIIAYVLNQIIWTTDDKNVELQVTGNAKEFYFVAKYSEKDQKEENSQSKLDNYAKENISVISDGIFTIRSALNDKYVVDVSGGSSANGANVQLYSENGSKAQKWIISHDEKGYVIITNEGSKKVLDVKGGESKNGVNIQQYEANNTKAQKWIAIKQSDGSVELVSALDPNKCIDLNETQTRNGLNIQLYETNNSKTQKWKLIRPDK